MRLFHPPVDLNAPRRPGERVFTTLQLTRLRTSAINFQRFVILALSSFVAASVVFLVIAWQAERAECRGANRARAEIRQAFEGLYDGFIVAAERREAAVEFKAKQMAELRRGLPHRDC